jgi:hypothetical protein
VRISVYRKGSTPQVDPAILRKSVAYVRNLVAVGEADWYDQDDESRGAILRSSNHHAHREINRLGLIAAGTMMSAWGIMQSGGGPLVWQMRTKREKGLQPA